MRFVALALCLALAAAGAPSGVQFAGPWSADRATQVRDAATGGTGLLSDAIQQTEERSSEIKVAGITISTATVAARPSGRDGLWRRPTPEANGLRRAALPIRGPPSLTARS